MNHQHAVIWIDHRETHVIKFGVGGVDRQILRSTAKAAHLHHKTNSIGSGRAPKDTEFFERVAAALQGVTAILVTGPANAKDELVDHIRTKHTSLAKAIEGIKTVDHPTEGELLTIARSFLKAADRLAT
jgi:stalled ribosome rescue protein Dom34